MTPEAELLANLPADGVRVFKHNLPCAQNFCLVAVRGRAMWNAIEYVPKWRLSDYERSAEHYATSDQWTEITPTLPDPSGDLPDGTRVRVTLEGIVSDWFGRGGTFSDGESLAVFRRYLNRHNATVEVLSLPTPPPSALDGKPGSLWRDPDTGGIYYRTANGKTSQGRPLLVLIDGDWNHDGWVLTAPNTEVVARLVQAEEGEQ